MGKLIGAGAVTIFVAAGVWLALACTSEGEAGVIAPGATASGMTSAGGYTGGAVQDGGSISGTVKYSGEVPKQGTITPNKDKEVCGDSIDKDILLVSSTNNGIKNVLVSITNITKGKEAKIQGKENPAVLDQKGCMYVPHVMVVDAGSWVVYKNSFDPISHNTNVASKFGQSFNKMLATGGASDPIQLKEAERMKIKCDIHPWMSAYLWVMESPYWALTGEDGSFKIDNVPPGTYKVKFWQERCKKVEKNITVEAGKDADADAEMKAKKKRR
ncbi:MAG: carboxypeptidase regulatory-like domain-containing protein [Planctomycetota bacterium]|nr:carboxypeptidase regulatory-like domain-containing protein [Planctomycetota bacterium]